MLENVTPVKVLVKEQEGILIAKDDSWEEWYIVTEDDVVVAEEIDDETFEFTNTSTLGSTEKLIRVLVAIMSTKSIYRALGNNSVFEKMMEALDEYEEVTAWATGCEKIQETMRGITKRQFAEYFARNKTQWEEVKDEVTSILTPKEIK